MRPYLWMVGGAVAFATMAELAYSLRADCPWQVIALARAAIPMLVTGLLLVLARLPLPFPAPAILWSRSLAGSVSLVCTFFALTRLPAADVLTLSNLVPLWVALFSWWMLGQKQSAGLWLSVIFGVLGVALSQQQHVLHGNFASVVAIIASISSAVALVSLNRVEGYDPRAIVFHFSFVSLGFALLAVAIMPRWNGWLRMHPGVTLGLLGIGLTATIGQFCLTKAYVTGNPAPVSVVGLSQVLFALLFDVLSGHAFTPMRMGGILLVVGSTAWVMLSLSGEKTSRVTVAAPSLSAMRAEPLLNKAAPADAWPQEPTGV